MGNYEDFCLMGLYREDSRTISGTLIPILAYPVCRTSGSETRQMHPKFRTNPHATDTYTLGCEFIEVTTCNHGGAHDGAFLATQLSSVSSSAYTLNAATWDTDIVTIGYYAAGTGTAIGAQTLEPTIDNLRSEWFWAILRAANMKGTVAPRYSGMVFDEALGVGVVDNTAIAADPSWTTIMEYDKPNDVATGYWALDHSAPFYITQLKMFFNTDTYTAEAAAADECGWRVRMTLNGAVISKSGGVGSDYWEVTATDISGSEGIPPVLSSYLDTTTPLELGYKMWPFGEALARTVKVELVRHDDQGACTRDDFRFYIGGWYWPEVPW